MNETCKNIECNHQQGGRYTGTAGGAADSPSDSITGKPVAMQVTLGEAGLSKTWQMPFEPETTCIHCGNVARIGFVAHEGFGRAQEHAQYVCNLHSNGDGGYWLHDVCAVAVYFCTECLNVTALYNQA